MVCLQTYVTVEERNRSDYVLIQNIFCQGKGTDVGRTTITSISVGGLALPTATFTAGKKSSLTFFVLTVGA